MSFRRVMLLVAAAYFVFSVGYLIFYGFEDPKSALWIGVIGIAVMAVGMTVGARGGRK